MNTDHVYTARMNPALNGSSALERFERGNAIEICNGIMFDFYPGLAHMYVCILGVRICSVCLACTSMTSELTCVDYTYTCICTLYVCIPKK